MQTRGSLEVIGKAARGAHDQTAAQAEADASLRAWANRRFFIEKMQKRHGIVHHFSVRELLKRLKHLRMCRLIKPVERDHFALRVVYLIHNDALPVIEVGHHAKKSDDCEPARDIIEFLAGAPKIHVDDNRGERPILFGMGDEGLHSSGGGRYFRKSFFHAAPPARSGAFPIAATARPA